MEWGLVHFHIVSEYGNEVQKKRIKVTHPYIKSVKVGDLTNIQVNYELPDDMESADVSLKLLSEGVDLKSDDILTVTDLVGRFGVEVVALTTGVHEIELVVEATSGEETLSVSRIIRVRAKS